MNERELNNLVDERSNTIAEIERLKIRHEIDYQLWNKKNA